MFIFQKRNTAFEIVDNEIYSYDIMGGTIREETEGKLISIIDEDVVEVERLLQIDSIEAYGVDIMVNSQTITLFEDESTNDISKEQKIFKSISNEPILKESKL